MISPPEYAARRRHLAKQLPKNSLAIIPAAIEVLRNGDAHYRFRQDSDFYYLTGFCEPDAVLLITSGDEGQSILFNRPRNPAQEQWTGARLGQESACDLLRVDFAYSIDEIEDRLKDFLVNQEAVYSFLGRYPQWDHRIVDAFKMVQGQVRRGVKAPQSFCDLSAIVSEMRLFKSAAELQVMQKAAAITVDAHKKAMQAVTKVQFEYELEAELSYEFIRQGSPCSAYDSIVAGGKNACILHYTKNNAPLHQGDLVLIDAGAEWNHYAADVTRTFPVSGRFSVEQKLLYEVVLKAQQAGIALCRPGCPWNMIQQKMIYILTQGLLDLGILQGQLDNLIDARAYLPFYMHNSGHWLGIDVHDTGDYVSEKSWRLLQAGMVLTVEPGLYIPWDMEQVAPQWRGIGIRIEDDICITPQGHMNLTADIPVNVDDIEALIRGS